MCIRDSDIDVLTNDVRDKLDMVSSMLPDEVETPIIFKFSTDTVSYTHLDVYKRQHLACAKEKELLDEINQELKV